MEKLRSEIQQFIQTNDDSFLAKYDIKEMAISQRLLEFLKQLKRNDQEVYKKTWIETIYQIIKQALKLRQFEAGPIRAMMIHQSIDEAIAEHKKRNPINAAKIKCKTGCSICCHQKISVTKEEALLLKDYPLDEKQLEEQQKLSADKNFQWIGRPCVFLKNNSCSVYKHRPNMCRLLLSVTDPKFCLDIRDKTVFYIHRAEVYSSAYFTALKKQLPLAHAISEVRNANL